MSYITQKIGSINSHMSRVMTAVEEQSSSCEEINKIADVNFK